MSIYSFFFQIFQIAMEASKNISSLDLALALAILKSKPKSSTIEDYCSLLKSKLSNSNKDESCENAINPNVGDDGYQSDEHRVTEAIQISTEPVFDKHPLNGDTIIFQDQQESFMKEYFNQFDYEVELREAIIAIATTKDQNKDTAKHFIRLIGYISKMDKTVEESKKIQLLRKHLRVILKHHMCSDYSEEEYVCMIFDAIIEFYSVNMSDEKADLASAHLEFLMQSIHDKVLGKCAILSVYFSLYQVLSRLSNSVLNCLQSSSQPTQHSQSAILFPCQTAEKLISLIKSAHSASSSLSIPFHIQYQCERLLFSDPLFSNYHFLVDYYCSSLGS
ncbi:uncharacterized protein V1516DRAFT_680551 [Lipomyces oligophaga]|uniref:uncharacterized protein n=1 Tax=Lipomyces oligophaga TaxID=45792 RepID=UPI0034CFA8F4